MTEFERFMIYGLLIALRNACDMADEYESIDRAKESIHHLAGAFTSFVYEMDEETGKKLHDAVAAAVLLERGRFDNGEDYRRFAETFDRMAATLEQVIYEKEYEK